MVTVAWLVILYLSYQITDLFIKVCGPKIKELQLWHSLKLQDQIEVSRQLTSTIHVVLALAFCTYGMLYADGKPGTNWFNNEEYRETAYDI